MSSDLDVRATRAADFDQQLQAPAHVPVGPLGPTRSSPNLELLPSPQLSMSAAQSPPPEILLEIFSFAGHYTPRDELFTTRYATLRGAALTCRAWTRMAQRVLWEDVRLENAQGVNAFAVGSAAGAGGATAALELVGGNGITSEEASRAVEACVGISHLVLIGLENLERSPLYLPGLAGASLVRSRPLAPADRLIAPTGLETLQIATSFFAKVQEAHLEAPPSFDFHLTRLAFHSLLTRDAWPTPFLSLFL